MSWKIVYQKKKNIWLATDEKKKTEDEEIFQDLGF